MTYNENADIDEDRLLSEVDELSTKFRQDISCFSLDYDELVNSFHRYVGRLIQINPINLYDNSLSRLVRDCMGDTIPSEFMKEFKRYEKDDHFIRRFRKITDYYHGCIEEGYAISDEEFNELYKLSLIDKNNSDKYTRYLLSQVIEGNNCIDKEMYKALIERFVKSVIKNNSLNVCFKIGKPEEIFGDEIADTIYRYGTYYVTYDGEKLNPENVLEDLEFVFHELWHTVQDSDEYSDAAAIELFKKDDYIRRIFGKTYYDENYERFSYEVDADMHAAMMLSQLLKDISPETYCLNKNLLDNKIDKCSELLYNRNRIFRGEEYDIDVLFDRARSKSSQTSEAILGDGQREKKLLKVINV